MKKNLLCGTTNLNLQIDTNARINLAHSAKVPDKDKPLADALDKGRGIEYEWLELEKVLKKNPEMTEEALDNYKFVFYLGFVNCNLMLSNRNVFPMSMQEAKWRAKKLDEEIESFFRENKVYADQYKKGNAS